jgi:transcriptional regulator with XRE-family HTH domain
MTKTLPAIAKALKDARKRARLSQQELARVSGVARITISGIEIGKHPSIRTSTAEKLAKSLGMSPGELLQLGQSPATELKIGRIDALLEAYHALKRGTVMVPSPTEDRWLRQQLAEWADERNPTATSVLFLLLAHRHAEGAPLE